MKFIKGRDNLSVTVYVPYDCSNNCKFCTSKKEYIQGFNVNKLKTQLNKIRNSSIREVVFTGGEPISNVDALKELISIVNNKDVYINTTFIKTNIAEFVKLVNNTSCIKGVNISRHGVNYNEDSKLLNNILEDELIRLIYKPVKINVVIPDNKIVEDFAKKVILRWSNFSNLKICFRANFNNTTPETLHSLSDPNIETLSKMGEFKNRNYCDVCDTVNFETMFPFAEYSYHRGLATTSIKFADVTEVNDIILFPNGELTYDWNRNKDNIEDMCKQFGIEDKIVYTPRVKNYDTGFGCGGRLSYGCGGFRSSSSGCGSISGGCGR